MFFAALWVQIIEKRLVATRLCLLQRRPGLLQKRSSLLQRRLRCVREEGDKRQKTGGRFLYPHPPPQGLWQLIDSAGAFWYCESGITFRGPGGQEDPPTLHPTAQIRRGGTRRNCWVRGMALLSKTEKPARWRAFSFLTL